MDLNVETEKFVMRVIKIVERNVSAGLRGTVKSKLRPALLDGSWDTEEEKHRRRKPKRARIHCKACGKVGHNSRNPKCPKKAKRAVLHVLKKAA